MAIWRMRIATWIPKATNTHSEYVIRIAFPLQQWLHERPSMLRYTYSAFLVRVNYYFLRRSKHRLSQILTTVNPCYCKKYGCLE